MKGVDMEIELDELIRKVKWNIRARKLLRVIFPHDKNNKRELKFFEDILVALLTLKQLLKKEQENER